jgi:DeoR family transcriptional regulator of aga operon
MLENERRKKILQQLLRDGEVTVFGSSRASQDLHWRQFGEKLTDLEGAGLLRRTRGGAVQVEPLFYEPISLPLLFCGQEQCHAAEKRRIGLAAAEIVKDGETIALGSGTTTTQVWSQPSSSKRNYRCH